MTGRVGRHVTSRVRARGWLRVESPLHVGGLDGDSSEPLPIAMDGLGRLYVPGTTLAGVLRQWSRGADPDSDLLDELWGYVPRQGEGGQASRVVVADALITAEHRLDERGLPAAPLDPAVLEFRHSVGIERVTGAAAQEFLYGRAVVPAGCHIRLEIDIESPRESAVDEARMAALLAALSAGEIRIGAATGRGLGAVRLLDHPLEVVVDRFDSPEGLLAVLRNDPARARTVTSLRSADPCLPSRRDHLNIVITWSPVAPVMIRARSAGLIVDTLPLTTRVDRRHLTLVLPGGSIKGMLRGHAELVERTARGVCAPSPAGATAAEHGAAFRAQLDQLPAVRALFGSARDDVTQHKAGALRAEECTALATIPDALWESVSGIEATPDHDESRDQWAARDDVGEARDRREFGDVQEPQDRWEAGDGPKKRLPDSVRDRLEDLGMAQADHVALDRWTGGAADGRLFSVLEPYAVEWEPIRLSIDLTRLGAGRDTALALLLLTLRDLAAGRIPLGASTNRGFGDIDVSEITVTGGPWPGPVSLADALAGPEILSIAHAWTGYLAQEVS